MQIIMLVQAYQEKELIKRFLQNRYEHCDKIIISEGMLTPFGAMPTTSADGTRVAIEEWIAEYDTKDKCALLESQSPPCSLGSREACEGWNKNRLLLSSEPENGDIIIVGDVDEFYSHDGQEWIIRQFINNEKIKTAWVEEWQFAYNLSLAFKSMHGSRFWRYAIGDSFGTTNHLYNKNRKEFTFDKSFIVPREVSGVCHLSWLKHPSIIRQKVVSFNREMFTSWFNNRFLKWPSNPDNRGFAEGHPQPLCKFTKDHSVELLGLSSDYFDEIKTNWRDYLIK